LGGSLQEIHYLLAIINTYGAWEWGKAEEEFIRALEIDPKDVRCKAYYAHYLNIMQRSDEASSQIEEALEMEPYNEFVQGMYGMHLNHTRQFDKAIIRLRNALEINPGNVTALGALWTIYHNKGMYNEALDVAKELYTEKREYIAVQKLIIGNQEGGYKLAMELVAEAFIVKMDTTFFTPWQLATLYTRSDNREEALYWLEKAYEAHDPNMPYISCDPIFDNIQDHSRFQELLAKMRLTN
jgi:tetratricopeptide (TPR) repeat protein